jgi:hypothetical protein
MNRLDVQSLLHRPTVYKKESPIGKLPKLQRAKAPESKKAKDDRIILSPAKVAKLMRKNNAALIE